MGDLFKKQKIALLAPLLWKLGFLNVLRVALHRVKLIAGACIIRSSAAPLVSDGIFYSKCSSSTDTFKLNDLKLFGWFNKSIEVLPVWRRSPFSDTFDTQFESHWHIALSKFTASADVKEVWELNRFSWVPFLAVESLKGNGQSGEILNHWMGSWFSSNLPYKGINWSCGQEAAIRVINCALASLILGETDDATPSLKSFIRCHLERVSSTLSYSLGQDNNHGSTEAAALFIGGSWLYLVEGDDDANRWARLGRKWLDNRAVRLIQEDGSSNQYSVNYHRVVLDTYCVVEIWRSLLNLPIFSPELYLRLGEASNWLYQLVQSETGDAPNLGANDGSMLLCFSGSSYRDYRPSVQLGMVLFCKKVAYSTEGENAVSNIDTINSLPRILRVKLPNNKAASPISQDFPQGGYSILRKGNIFALLRYPAFRFRPSQSDALHLDLWQDGHNLLPDGGTYSYNSSPEVAQYFSGTSSHNTIEFDDRDQMPRLGRFLFGAWLKAKNIKPVEEVDNALKSTAAYKDYLGVSHKRSVSLSNKCLQVTDSFSGFKNKAVLRWRLQPGEWSIAENVVSNGKHNLIIEADIKIKRFEIVEGWESLFYLQKTPLPVLEVEVDKAGEIMTTYQFKI